MHKDNFLEHYIVLLLKLYLDSGSFTTYDKDLLINVFLFKYEPSLFYRLFDLVDAF